MLSTLPAGRISSAYRKLKTGWQHRAALTGGMSYSEPARTAGRRKRSTILAAALVVVTAALSGVLGYPSLAVSPSPATSPKPIALRPHDSLRRDHQGAPAMPTLSSLTARRSSMTTFRRWPTLTRVCCEPSAEPQPMLRATGSSSTSSAAGGPGSTRNNCSVRQSPSTARKRKQPDGSPPRAPLLTKRETRSTSDTPMPRRGYPNTAPGTGCARSTATKPGTTSHGPTRSITVARLCTPTPRSHNRNHRGPWISETGEIQEPPDVSAVVAKLTKRVARSCSTR